MKKTCALILPLIVLAGCSSKPPMVIPTTSKIVAGTPVNAILLSDLTSGGSHEGDPVALMVTQEIADKDGTVLVPKGTPILGQITQSRGEGSLGSMMNQPARLAFKIGDLQANDGTKIALSADKTAEKDYELNRDNTGKITASTDLDEFAADKKNQPAFEALKSMFADGQGTVEDQTTRDEFTHMADSLGLTATDQIAKEGELDQLSDFVKQLKNGSAAALIASGGSSTLVNAALELAGIASQVGNRLGRVLGGRNIHAYIGTPVIVYVSHDAVIKLPPTPSATQS